LAGAKTSEAANLDLIAALQSSNNGFEESIYDDFTIASGEVAEGGDFVYEVSFGHIRIPFVLWEGDRGRAENIPFLLIIDGM
jgi:hypothetical protein